MEKPSDSFLSLIAASTKLNPSSTGYEIIQGSMLALLDQLWEEVERLKRERAEGRQ